MVIFQTRKHIDLYRWGNSHTYAFSIHKGSVIKDEWEISISFWRYELVIYLYDASGGSEIE